MATSSSSSSNQDNQQKVQFPLDSSAYENLQEIGSGDKVVVYKAVCVPMNSAIVAIKSVDLNQSTADFESKLRDTKNLSLSHPNILGDHCSFTTAERRLWVVMPFMTFGSLQSVIIAPSAFPGGLPEPSIAVVLKETLNAMSYLHGHGRFHGDIKPANILVDSDGSVKLADFGVSASFYNADFSTGANDTSTRPYWEAPGGGGYKADIWAFGITALELALGGPPLSGLPLLLGNQILKIKNRFRLVDYENIIKDFRNQKYSAAFKDLVGSCIDRDPEKRPAAEALLKHPFFHDCGGKDYLVGTVLPHLESVEERFKKRNRGLGMVNYGELKGKENHIYGKGFMQSGRGTTNILVVLPDALIVAGDSRLTAYSGEIRPEEKKVQRISKNPPTRATWCRDRYDAHKMLRHIKRVAKASHSFDAILDSARKYTETTNCRRGFGSFLCSVEPTTGELSAYLVFHNPVVKHETNCSKKEEECYCQNFARFHGCRKLKLGVYTLGSGGQFAMDCLSEKYGFEYKWDDPSLSWYSDGEKAQDLGIDDVENARADVFSALLTAAFDDPLSGVPFRVSIIRKKEKISTVKHRFLQAYSRCDPVMLGPSYIGTSAYLVYPTVLEYNDNGKTAVQALTGDATSLLWWKGHPLTILKGEFTLHQIIFSEEKHLTNALKGLKKVRKCPPFTKDITNLQVKYYRCGTKEGKIVRVYVTKDLGQPGFLESLLEQKF